MRIGAVRSDISKVYISDVENRSQRNFSSEPAGQSVYVSKPTVSQIEAVMGTYAILSAKGDDNGATYDTSINNVLKIKASSSAPFTTITVTANVALAKSQLVAELNAGFALNDLAFKATVLSGADANKVQIDTVSPNAGPDAYLEIDTAANGSTLNIAINSGWPITPPVLSGLPVATLVTAIYPTSTTIDISSATILALSTFPSMQAVDSTALVDAIANAIAPKLVETGPVLLSFAYGVISKLRSSSFQPGGSRVGLPAGYALYVLQDDGSTPFTL